MKTLTEGLKEFRNEIIVWALVMAVLAEVISLFVIGPGVMFPLGLAMGTAVAIFGFILLVKSGEASVVTRTGTIVVLGYFFALILHGIFFFICIRLSLVCAVGCGCGFLTIHFGIMFLYGIVYKFFKKKENPLNDWTEPKEWNDLSVYDEEDDNW